MNRDAESHQSDVLQELELYARDDWLDIQIVASWLRAPEGQNLAFPLVRDRVVDAIYELIKRGAIVGDVCRVGETWEFAPWQGSTNDALARLRQALHNLDRYPQAGEIGWLTINGCG